MTRANQIEFTNSILDSLKEEIIKKTDKMPENWDGFEIRQFISDYYTSHYIISDALKGSRKKDYKNTLLIRNLI